MKRREFLEWGIPATGAFMLAPGLFGNTARGAGRPAEMDRQFAGNPGFDIYDVLVNGGGLGGYFAALHAARSGKKVLLVEKRAGLGYELTAKGRLFLEKEGFGQFSGEMLQLFIPEGEAAEVHNPKGGGRGKSLIGDEVLLLAGSLKKGMLRNLLLGGVDVLLMTEVCGVFSDEGKVSGAMLAGKHGVYAVKCRHFVDTDDCLVFSRGLAGSDMPVREASFVLEVWKASAPVRKTVSVPAGLGITGNKITLHPGKHADHQVFLEFSFSAEGLDMDAIEHRSRQIAEKLGAAFPQLDPSLAKAEITQFAWECGYTLRDPALPSVRLKGHHLSGSRPVRSCQDILAIRKQAEEVVSGLPADSSGRSWKQLHMAGSVAEASEIRFSPLNEPGLQFR